MLVASDRVGPPEEYDFPHVARMMWGARCMFAAHKRTSAEQLLAPLRATRRTVVPVGSPLALGPQHATVAREIGRQRPRRPHLHLMAAFAKRHRWKRVRQELRDQHGIEARPQMCPPLELHRVGVFPGPLVGRLRTLNAAQSSAQCSA